MTQQRHALTDEQWQRMAVHLPPVGGRPGRDDRLFIDAVLWMTKTGALWRDLPARFGVWAQVYQRFARWSERGYFKGAVPGFARARSRSADGGLDFFKAHQASAAAQKKWISSDWRLSQRAEHQIHAVCDALGNPLRLKLTAGTKSDTPELTGLIQSLPSQELLGDKQSRHRAGGGGQRLEVVIPPKANRNEKRAFDALKYQASHWVENLFQRMKVYPKETTRDEKLDTRFPSIVYLVDAMKWLQ